MQAYGDDVGYIVIDDLWTLLNVAFNYVSSDRLIIYFPIVNTWITLSLLL